MNSTPPNPAVLLLLDGLRPEPLAAGRMPTLAHLASQGAASLSARSQLPSITLPCITSLFLSLPPGVHGTLSNTWQPHQPPFPGLFEVFHAAGRLTGSFYGWDPLRDLSRPEVLDYACYQRSADPIHGDTPAQVCQAAGAWIAAQRPGFTFVYVELPDQLGHSFGFLSPEYWKGCEQVDCAVALLVESLQAAGLLEQTVLTFLADHGGHGQGHGSDLPEDMTIPLVLRGPGVRPGASLDGASLIDVAPTLAHLCGLPIPGEWQGHVLTQALA